MRFVITILLGSIIILHPVHGCKLWAICTINGSTIPTMSTDEHILVQDELTSFYAQSESMAHGWAFLSYPDTNHDSLTVWHRSANPAIQDSTLYWSIVDSMLTYETSSLAVGHLRLASSGTDSIPNPHPWLFYQDNKTYSLVHNGTLNKTILYNLITQDSTDISWLIDNPPNTFGNGDWMEGGWSSVVDSELLMLFIMQKINETDNVFLGLQSALWLLVDQGVLPIQLNTIFSDGDSLFVYGGRDGLSIASSDEHFVVMTSPATHESAGSMNWDGLSQNEMVIINESGITFYPNFATVEPDPFVPLPSDFLLLPPYPNPFNSTVTIPYELNIGPPMTISIYSLKGESLFETVISRDISTTGEIEWMPYKDQQKLLSTGVYIVKAASGEFTQTQKILFIK